MIKVRTKPRKVIFDKEREAKLDKLEKVVGITHESKRY